MRFEWKEYLLGDITDNFDGKRVPIKESDRIPGNIPYYGASGIVDYVEDHIFDGEYLLVAEDGENLKTRKTPIAFMATGKFWVNNHAHIIRGNSLADTRYLLYALQNTSISGYLTGSTMPKLTQGNLNRIKLTLPPLPVQKRIAEILGVLDDKIELNRQMNVTLEQIAQAIFKSWFVDYEPWGGKMPEAWREGTLSDIANITMGQSPEGTSYNEAEKGTVFYQGRAEFGSRFPTRRLFTTKPKRMASKGDVLMSVRAPVGDINVAFESCCVGRGLAAIQSNNDSQSFILYTMFALHQQLEKFNGEGTVFGSINKNDMANLPVLIPTDDVIRQFEKLVSPMDVTIETNYAESCNLQFMRDTLLPRLMSGELSVAEFA